MSMVENSTNIHDRSLFVYPDPSTSELKNPFLQEISKLGSITESQGAGNLSTYLDASTEGKGSRKNFFSNSPRETKRLC